jgi:hypothetical protein
MQGLVGGGIVSENAHATSVSGGSDTHPSALRRVDGTRVGFPGHKCPGQDLASGRVGQ